MMKRQPRILAGAALALSVACRSVAAMPLYIGDPQTRSIAGSDAAPLILAQGEQSRGDEALKKRQTERAARAKAEQQAEQGEKQRQQAERSEKRHQQAEQAQKQHQQAEQAQKQHQQAERNAANKREADAAAKKRQAEQAARQAEKKGEQVENAAKKHQAEAAATKKRQAEAAATKKRQAEAAATKKRQAEAAAERKRRAESDAVENAARQAEKKAVQTKERREQAEADAEKKREASREAAEEAARRKRQAESDEAQQGERLQRRDREAIVDGEEESQRVRRAGEAEEKPVRERQAREQDDDRDEITESGDDTEKRRAKRRLFDSAKERRSARRERNADEIEVRPLPRNDRDAQKEAIAREVRPGPTEDGVRVERRERRRERRPEGTEILRELGDRLILQFGDQVVVESDDRRRLSRGAREVYTEELRNGRTRETIIRLDGTRIVTIRNIYGDVIRRSRFTRDGREQVLSYVDESDYDRLRDWRDLGLDLPPIRIDIPEDEYIFDASDEYDADDYYEFLDQPPVEQVQRLYSVDEVKRSARVRDITRRVDLDTITFEFGSASIAESEIKRLEDLANAMDRMLKENPAETFLIEGHTDAVGSDLANLVLSDRRAEAVALALTDVFGLPPENLTTQGYGEEYLKIDTSEPERENRRVAVRRITPLVAPVASAD